MSMNLVLKVNNEEINIPQTTTKETNKILGTDVDNLHVNGISTPFEANSRSNIHYFLSVFERFKHYALDYSTRIQDVDNDAVKAVILIQNVLDNSHIEESLTISFSFR